MSLTWLWRKIAELPTQYIVVGAATAQDDPAANVHPPLSKHPAQWIQEAVGGALGAFGAHIEEKFAAMDADIAALLAKSADAGIKASAATDLAASFD